MSCNILVQAYRKKNQKKGVQKSSESSQDGRSSPALSSTNDDIPTGAGSKYQQKKAKKQAKKQAKVFKWIDVMIYFALIHVFGRCK